MDDLLTVKQVSRILKVHELTIRRYILEGKLKAQKIGGNIRIPKMEVLKLSQEYSPQIRTTKRVLTQKPLFFQPNDALFRLKGRAFSIEKPEGR